MAIADRPPIGAVCTGPKPVDFSALSKPPADFFAGQNAQHDLAVQNAFKDGLPTTDGTANGPIDYQAAYRKMLQMGAPEQANQMLQGSITQQALPLVQKALSGDLGAGSSPAPAGAPLTDNAPAPGGDYVGQSKIAENSDAF